MADYDAGKIDIVVGMMVNTLALPYFQLLSIYATSTLVQAFVSCQLDYCNSLLYTINNGLLRCVHSACAEFRNMLDHGHSSMYHSTLMATAMPSSSSASHFHCITVTELIRQSLAEVAPA